MDYGKTKRACRIALVAAAFALAGSIQVYGQEPERQRGFFFELGAGVAEPSYGYELESIMAEVEAVPGVTRIKIALNLGLGWALSQKTYLLGRVQGIGDRLSDGYDFLQVNLYLYSLALRTYPFTTGLFLGGGAGMTRAVAVGSGAGSLGSDPGLGASLGFGYDFADKTGFGLSLGLDVLYLVVEGDAMTGVQATVNLGWK